MRERSGSLLPKILSAAKELGHRHVSVQESELLIRIETSRRIRALPRFRDSWFVQAGIVIAGVSLLPFIVVSLTGLIAGREFGVGQLAS
jgi:hypothetical protein